MIIEVRRVIVPWLYYIDPKNAGSKRMSPAFIDNPSVKNKVATLG